MRMCVSQLARRGLCRRELLGVVRVEWRDEDGLLGRGPDMWVHVEIRMRTVRHDEKKGGGEKKVDGETAPLDLY